MQTLGHINLAGIADSVSLSSETCSLPTSLIAPEGIYRQMTISEYSRLNRMPINQGSGPLICNAPCRVSFLILNDKEINDERTKKAKIDECKDLSLVERICFNMGRELYVYEFNGVNHCDAPKLIDKRVYKGTYPTCHDFNQFTAQLSTCSLIIGFSAGQVQLVDPNQKENINQTSTNKLYNEERLYDRTAISCIKWIPGNSSLFMVSHFSGNLYVYHDDYPCASTIPTYQIVKQSDDYIVSNVKSKTPRNPLQKWTIGKGPINKFDFSDQDAKFLAAVSQDGFLRVFEYRSMELIGFFKSYYGGLLCLSWSPDAKLIATGGEDDMLSVYSVCEKRVIARGQGHKSWISDIAFDKYAFNPAGIMCETNLPDQNSRDLVYENPQQSIYQQLNCSNTSSTDCQFQPNGLIYPDSAVLASRGIKKSNPTFNDLRSHRDSFSYPSLAWIAAGVPVGNGGIGCEEHAPSAAARPLYRIGTVGHDCRLCLWDLTDDVLSNENAAHITPNNDHLYVPEVHEEFPRSAQPPPLLSTSPSLSPNPRASTIIPIGIESTLVVPHKNETNDACSTLSRSVKSQPKDSKGTGRLKRFHKRGLSLSSGWKLSGWRSNGVSSIGSNVINGENAGMEKLNNNQNLNQLLFGTAQCPRIDDIPMIEPLVCKKISNERLTMLYFKRDCFVTACQEGLVSVWARPTESKDVNGKVFCEDLERNYMAKSGSGSYI